MPIEAVTNNVNNADGLVHFSFVNVSQGDCCIVKTPLGRVFMFDCGSTYDRNKTALNNIKKSLYNSVSGISNAYSQIDGIFLSHPDQDHYNKIVDLAEDLYLRGIVVKKAFVSMHADLFNAHDNVAYRWIRRVPGDWSIPEATYTVRLNSNNDRNDQGKIDTIMVHWEKVYLADDGDMMTDDEVDENGKRYRNFKIKILAAGVTPELDGNLEFNDPNNDQKNTASIVTLIEFGQEKFLIMGDATTPVGRFLVEHFSEEISDVDILHVPHHGSRRHSLDSEFWSVAFPDTCVVSVSPKNDAHHLPAYETLMYAANVALNEVGNRDHYVYKYESTSPWQLLTENIPRYIEMDEFVDMNNIQNFREYRINVEHDPNYVVLEYNYRKSGLISRGQDKNVYTNEGTLSRGVLSLKKDIHMTSADNIESIYFAYNGKG